MAARQYEPESSEASTRLSPEEVEMVRRQRAIELNRNPGSASQLEARYGRVWNPDELARDFEVIGFAAPYVVVRWGASSFSIIPGSTSISRPTNPRKSIASHLPRTYFQDNNTAKEQERV